MENALIWMPFEQKNVEYKIDIINGSEHGDYWQELNII